MVNSWCRAVQTLLRTEDVQAGHLVSGTVSLLCSDWHLPGRKVLGSSFRAPMPACERMEKPSVPDSQSVLVGAARALGKGGPVRMAKGHGVAA